MAHQLPLFQKLDTKTNRSKDADRPVVDELVLSLRRFQNSTHYLEMLDFVSRFSRYSIFNSFLLFLQRPASTMVATAGVWASKYGRQPKPGAQPLIILAPMSPVRFLFDIQDTVGEPVPPVQPKQGETAAQLRSMYENTVHNASLHGIAIRETLGDSGFSYQVRRRHPGNRILFNEHRVPEGSWFLVLLQVPDPMEKKYQYMTRALGEILCGHLGAADRGWWKDRSEKDDATRRWEARSVAYLVLRRAGFPVTETAFFSADAFLDTEMPPVMTSCVFLAAQYIEEMTTDLWETPRKTGFKGLRG